MLPPEVSRASFDLFDTLLSRPFCRPWQLFMFVGRHHPARGVLACILPYAWLRRGAEFTARLLSLPREEIRFSDLRRVLRWLIRNADELLEAELAIERRCLRPLPHGVALFRAAEARHLRPLVISDMYLPAAFLREVLADHGLHPAGLFVSSEIGLRKGSGNLFRYILAKEGGLAESWVHVGDHKRSDQSRPAALGWKTLPLDPPLRAPLDHSLLGSVVAALEREWAPEEEWVALGHRLIGPLRMGACAGRPGPWTPWECLLHSGTPFPEGSPLVDLDRGARHFIQALEERLGPEAFPPETYRRFGLRSLRVHGWRLEPLRESLSSMR